MEQNLTSTIKESFIQFSGAVLQSRALPDVRDCMKPSARQIFYCLYTDKFIHSKPYQKTLKAIGSAFRMYIHGDSSAEGVIMRAAQPFAMRYPLIEVEGSYGNLLSAGSWAAPRYTSSRLTELAETLFADIKKDTIEEWRDNYDNTEQYPMVLPSKGFFNLVNGSYGIGVGASSSIPQYNLKELNDALITLLWNPEVDFEDIYCPPDFATGGILLNNEEVKESHRNGTGAACKIRSKVEYDSKDRCFIVTEIPYMVYTETICKELEEVINGEDNPGIDRFNDLTGKTPLIKIYLNKNANPDKVLINLFKNTSLQSYYSVNFTMLENGRFPKVFTWKEVLQAHLNHEKQIYVNGFKYDLAKMADRIHIIDGLLKAYDLIDEVIATIKTSSSAEVANVALQKLLKIDSIQAKAILDLKLSRLSKLDINKLINERNDLIKESERIQNILNNEELLKKEIENGLLNIARKFGDSRRTIIKVEEENKPVEVRSIQVSLTNQNAVYIQESSSLYVQRRGGVGSKIKLNKEEYIRSSITINSNDKILFFTNKGNFYHCEASELPIGEKISLYSQFNLNNELVRGLTTIKSDTDEYLIFITKHGLIKKSSIKEYNISRKGALKAIALEENDEIIEAINIKDEKIGILTHGGNFIIITTNDIRPIGRVTKGIKGIKLNTEDYVVSSRKIPNETKTLVSISQNGYIKQTPISEFNIQGKNTKGSKIQNLNQDDYMADFYPLNNELDLLIAASNSCIKISTKEIPLLTKNTLGVKAIKLPEKSKIIEIS